MNEIPKKILLSVLTTLILGVIYFAYDNWIYPTPDVSGKWEFETTVESTSYDKFQGMKLTYEVFLTQNNEQLSGKGEKFKEDLNGAVMEYIGTQRTPIIVTGRVEKKFLGKHIIHIQYELKGKIRDTTAQQKLELQDNTMNGRFSSTIARESGAVVWHRQEY